MKSSRTRLAFTLIELLVVIAIISLLVSILIPSLQKAKELARESVCTNNLHNIGLGFHYYVNDNNGTLPPSNLDTSTALAGQSNGKWWTNLLSVYLPVKYWKSESWGSVGFDSGQMWTCPTVTWTMVHGYEGWGAGYGIAEEGAIPMWAPPLRIDQIHREADILLVADCQLPLSGDGLCKTYISMYNPPWDVPPRNLWQQAARWHRDGSNVCFIDGHVNWRSWDSLNEQEGLPFSPEK